MGGEACKVIHVFNNELLSCKILYAHTCLWNSWDHKQVVGARRHKYQFIKSVYRSLTFSALVSVFWSCRPITEQIPTRRGYWYRKVTGLCGREMKKSPPIQTYFFMSQTHIHRFLTNIFPYSLRSWTFFVDYGRIWLELISWTILDHFLTILMKFVQPMFTDSRLYQCIRISTEYPPM